MPDCTGWIAGVEPVSEAVIRAAPSLRVISRNGTGIDNLPLRLLAERRIIVRTAAGANAAGVAELAIALMLASLRGLTVLDSGIKAGMWPRPLGGEIRGRLIGVIGCGAVGREVVRLSLALGARVIAHDPGHPDLGDLHAAIRWAGIDTILHAADIVSLHCPLSGDGRALLGAEQLATMRSGAIIVNTARAALVDEEALHQALISGRIAGYATDVFAVEPPASLQLAGHPNVVATSHVGGLTRESVDRATKAAVVNLLESLDQPAKINE